jgi:hypothetical protein
VLLVAKKRALEVNQRIATGERHVVYVPSKAPRKGEDAKEKPKKSDVGLLVRCVVCSVVYCVATCGTALQHVVLCCNVLQRHRQRGISFPECSAHYSSLRLPFARCSAARRGAAAAEGVHGAMGARGPARAREEPHQAALAGKGTRGCSARFLHGLGRAECCSTPRGCSSALRTVPATAYGRAAAHRRRRTCGSSSRSKPRRHAPS